MKLYSRFNLFIFSLKKEKKPQLNNKTASPKRNFTFL